MRPDVSDLTEELYASLIPGATARDEELDWPLLRFCAALSTIFEKGWEIAQPYKAENPPVAGAPPTQKVGWVHMFNPWTVPVWALDYFGQFAGVRMQEGWTEEQKRSAIATPSGFARGTLEALVNAVKGELTGSKSVLVFERYTGDAYRLAVRTYDVETPSDDAVIAAILTQKPAGIVLDYDSIPGVTYAQLQAANPTYADVEANQPTYEDVLNPPP